MSLELVILISFTLHGQMVILFSKPPKFEACAEAIRHHTQDAIMTQTITIP